jgi:ATP-binding cassette subfamily F protein 2
MRTHSLTLVHRHSADFMDEVCTNIMDLTLKKKLLYYGGNYSTYVRTKSDNEVNQTKAYAKQQEEIAHIKSEWRPFLLGLLVMAVIGRLTPA